MNLVWNKATDPIATLLFAHGAGAGLDSDFMVEVAEHVASMGVNVARFDFDYMQVARAQNKRRPPDKAPKLLACFKQHIEQIDDNLPLFLAGKSMGGRMATLLACENLAIHGVVALGYPFHPPGKPDKLRTEHLDKLTVPCLIVQGERDTFGTKQEVATFGLPTTLQMYWLVDGDHSFKPRKASDFTESAHRLSAAKALVAFIQEQL
jgi:predicted alpha/beta-hydrolase family hydrolase